MLNFDSANVGLDLIAHGDLAPFPPDELAGRTHRLIERLLDQIDVQKRAPTESEDTFLRRSILLYQAKDFKESIGYAFRAAKVGNVPIAFEIDEPDRSISLRSLLATQAK